MENERKKLSIDQYHKLGIKGQNIGVAVLDTGIRPHLDFVLGRNRIVKFWSVQSGYTAPHDINGHGTAVAGILAGNGVLSGGKFSGVAPKASIIGVKVIADNGIGDTNSILEGMRFVYKNKKSLNIRIVCMSFGSEPVDPDPIMKGAQALWNQGIVVVASGGNNGPQSGTIRSPGVSPEILTVGGIDFDEYNKPFVVDFSSRGPWRGFSRPDIVAPAVDIYTTGAKKDYTKMTGTSMAAPIIAGAAALMLTVNPELTPNKIKELLLTHATHVDQDPNASGWGLINISQTIAAISP